MKKIILFILAIISCVGIAKADEGPFYLSFKTENYYSAITSNVVFKGEYVFTNSSDPYEIGRTTEISLFDNDGKCKKTNTLDGITVYHLATDDKNIYALAEEKNGGERKFYTYKINSDLEVVGRIETEFTNTGFYSDDYIEYDSYNSENFFRIEDNKIRIFGCFARGVDDCKVMSVDLDLQNVTTERIMESQYMKDIQMMIKKQSEDVYGIEAEPMGNDILMSRYDRRGICDLDAEPNQKTLPKLLADESCKELAVLDLYDKEGNLKWSKEFENYHFLHNIRVTKDYIFALGDTEDYYKSKRNILILNHNGEIVETINPNARVGAMEVTNAAIALTQAEVVICPTGFTEYAECTNKITHNVYAVRYQIETKVTSGKGTIEAIRSSKPGDPVTFVVTPEEGYVLSVVKVTDANGKVVTFTDYTFTMPSADVLIEATFLPKNPETKDLAIALIIMLAILTGVITLIEGKKLRRIME